MGASNSTPQTAEFINPKPSIPAIIVTPEVITRLENAKHEIAEAAVPEPVMKPVQECPTCSVCRGRSVQLHNNLLQMKADELQERQFKETLTKLETMLGNPVKWNEEDAQNLKMLKKRLIQCHTDNPREPLRCSTAAQEYQDFVYQHQYDALLEAKNIKKE